MDGFMETGDGLDAVFEAALLGADVPQAVWDAINASGGTLGLNAAYTAYERDQAKAEAEKLRGQLAAAQKMGANRAASTGSMEGAGEDDMDAEFKRILLS